jgi:hypothetical protein
MAQEPAKAQEDNRVISNLDAGWTQLHQVRRGTGTVTAGADTPVSAVCCGAGAGFRPDAVAIGGSDRLAALHGPLIKAVGWALV